MDRTYNAGVGVNLARKCIDGNDMAGLVIPRTTILPPICGGYFFPGVVVGVIAGENFHCCGVARICV